MREWEWGGSGSGGRTDAEGFCALEAEALGDDEGPGHHDRGAVDDGGLGGEGGFVEELVEVEGAQLGGVLCGALGEELVCGEIGGGCAFAALLGPWRGRFGLGRGGCVRP